jgi:hypothetical protein
MASRNVYNLIVEANNKEASHCARMRRITLQDDRRSTRVHRYYRHDSWTNTHSRRGWWWATRGTISTIVLLVPLIPTYDNPSTCTTCLYTNNSTYLLLLISYDGNEVKVMATYCVHYQSSRRSEKQGPAGNRASEFVESIPAKGTWNKIVKKTSLIVFEKMYIWSNGFLQKEYCYAI